MSDVAWWLLWPVLIVLNGAVFSAALALVGKGGEPGMGCLTAVFSGTIQWGALLAAVYVGGAMGVINGIGIFAISLIPYTMLMDTPVKKEKSRHPNHRNIARRKKQSQSQLQNRPIVSPPNIAPTGLSLVAMEMEQMAQQPTPQPPPTTTMQTTTTTATPVHVSYDKRIERRFEALEFRKEKDT